MGNREAIQALFDAYANRDAETMLGCLDDAAEWIEAAGFPYAGTYVGPQAVMDNVWRPMATEWDGWSAVPDEIIVEGDRVVAVGTYSGAYKATGKAFSARFAHVFTMKNDKVIRMEQFVDSATVNAALQSAD
jgi:ketosteroid isomerase-like protein